MSSLQGLIEHLLPATQAGVSGRRQIHLQLARTVITQGLYDQGLFAAVRPGSLQHKKKAQSPGLRDS